MKNIPEFSSIQLLKQELGKLGYTSETIVLDNDNYTRFVSPKNKVWFTANTHINYPFASSAARRVSDKKHLAYELAEKLSLRAPKTQLVDTRNADYAAGFPEMLSAAPLVVKPNNSSLSRGLKLNIRDLQTLRQAVEAASEFSPRVLVQEQVQGEEIRFVVLNGEVTAALLRRTARLTGDGQSTVKQLLDAENAERATIKLPHLGYPQLVPPLISLEKLDMDRVLGDGEIIELSKSTMIKGGASVYNVLTDTHPSYLETAQKLANTLGHGFVVVDIFVEDYTQPQTDQNYAFIEFNMSPVLKLCYGCRDGNNYEVLRTLVPMIDASLHAGEGNA